MLIKKGSFITGTLKVGNKITRLEPSLVLIFLMNKISYWILWLTTHLPSGSVLKFWSRQIII